MPNAYVDADTFKWRYAAAAEYDMYRLTDGTELRTKTKAKEYLVANPDVFVESMEGILDPLENVLHSVKLAMEEIQRVCKCEQPAVYIGKGLTFRNTAYNLYKFDRSDREHPVHYEGVKTYLEEIWNAETITGIEADDALAIAITEDRDGIICSQDKDLLQVPGKHFNFVTGEKTTISGKEADFNLFSQILTGDTTDGIPGIKGIGPAKAKKILDGCKSGKQLYDLTKDSYENDTLFLLNANLIFLLRKEGQSFNEWCEIRGFCA